MPYSLIQKVYGQNFFHDNSNFKLSILPKACKMRKIRIELLMFWWPALPLSHSHTERQNSWEALKELSNYWGLEEEVRLSFLCPCGINLWTCLGPCWLRDEDVLRVALARGSWSRATVSVIIFVAWGRVRFRKPALLGLEPAVVWVTWWMDYSPARSHWSLRL